MFLIPQHTHFPICMKLTVTETDTATSPIKLAPPSMNTEQHKPKNRAIPQEVVRYVETQILPRYAAFDAAHREDHARSVIARSLALAEKLGVRTDMAYVVAAYHDLGLKFGREQHHTESARILLGDERLRSWFKPEELQLMADACEDHRASSAHPPRSVYGRIVAEADRLIDPETVIRRTVQYGLAHYPELPPDGHIRRAEEHLRTKYGEGGYLRLLLAESPNAAPLRRLPEDGFCDWTDFAGRRRSVPPIVTRV